MSAFIVIGLFCYVVITIGAAVMSSGVSEPRKATSVKERQRKG